MAAKNGKNRLPRSAKEAVLTGYIYDPENCPLQYYELGGVGGFELIEGQIPLMHIASAPNPMKADLVIPFKARLELGKPRLPKPDDYV
jgi:hypothetical protein